jgi:hypothetical protein
VQAVPAVYGPADGQRDASGHINCEVSDFVLSGPGLPTVYLSGANASMGAVKDVADRVGEIDMAVLFAGAARVATKERGRPLTLTGARAAAAAELLSAKLVIPPTSTAGPTSARASTNSSQRSTRPGSAACSGLPPTASGSTGSTVNRPAGSQASLNT